MSNSLWADGWEKGYQKAIGESAQREGSLLADIERLKRENAELRGAMKAQDERNTAACERVGLPTFDCDTPDHLADEIEALRSKLAAAQARVKRLDALRINRWLLGKDPFGYYKQFIVCTHGPRWPDCVVADGDTEDEAIDAAVAALGGSVLQHEAIDTATGERSSKGGPA